MNIGTQDPCTTSARLSWRHLLAVVLALGAALSTGIGPVASTAHGSPDSPFHPALSVSADTQVAGEHPTIEFRLSKPENRCLDRWDREGMCDESDMYEEQDFKKLEVTLPEGLVADPNAVPRGECEFSKDTLYTCPEASRIGTLDGLISPCVPSVIGETFYRCGWPGGDPGLQRLVGDVYMGITRPGEQAHLIIALGLDSDTRVPGVEMQHGMLVDMSVRVDPAGRITTVIDDIPNYIIDPPSGILVPGQPWLLSTTLFGRTGAGSGHPLLTNPSSCAGKSFTGTAQGYAYNMTATPVVGDFLPSQGDGKVVPVSTAYHATGCNSLPYAPTFDLRLDPPTPNAAPAITSTITQEQGEQTTGKVTITFPKGFQVNFDNNRGQCTTPEFESRSCPADSAIGEAVANSQLLPEDSGPLTGSVYLGETDFAAGDIKLLIDVANDWLPGGIRLAGNTRIAADGSLVADFDQVPELPMSSFKLSLWGGREKGLLKNPKHCGARDVNAAFTSHQGKIHKVAARQAISCDPVGFELDYGSRLSGAHPTLGLSVFGSEGIKSVKFTLSRHLKRPGLSRLRYGRSYGALTSSSREEATDAKLVLVRGSRKGSLLFSATEGGAQVASLGIGQHTKLKRKKTRRGKRKRVRTKAGSELWFRDIGRPTELTVELQGSQDDLLTNPSRCRHRRGKLRGKRIRLNFIADVVDSEGTLYRFSDSVKVKCRNSKRRASRKNQGGK